MVVGEEELPLKEYAELTGVSVDTVRRRLRSDQLEGTFRNGKWWVKVKVDDLPVVRSAMGNLESVVVVLQEQLRIKDHQIASLLDLLHKG